MTPRETVEERKKLCILVPLKATFLLFKQGVPHFHFLLALQIIELALLRA